MILILADAFDTHADVVQKHLRALNASTFRLDLDVVSLRRTEIYFGKGEWTVIQNGKKFLSSDVVSVWPRRLTVSLTLEQQTEPETRSFRLWRSEWNRSLYGLYSYLRSSFWMNPIHQSSLADNKYYQFSVASEVGFQIPELISSNSRRVLRDFAQMSETAIKLMTQDIYKMDDDTFSGIYVNKVSDNDLQSFGDFGENPITLQRYIDKKFEVRHTFVCGQHFSCKIESQKSDRANVDWRRYDIANTPHSIITPPSKIIVMIETLMKRLGLIYGAFDFIVDKAGNWWYLEVNSAGQWLWIEDLLDLPISASIAGSLSEGFVGVDDGSVRTALS